MKIILSILIVCSCNFLSSGQLTLSPKITIQLTDSVQTTTVKDQGQSPTCWVFGANSIFESDLLKKYKIEADLSEMFVARYAYIDKARVFLATGGKTYFEGGGQFHDVIRVVKRYGMLPESVYNGKPDGQSVHDHSKLDTAMMSFTYELLRKGRTELSSNDLNQMNDTLDLYLGKVPQAFTYEGKKYTPETFGKEMIPFADGYVEFISFSNLPLYQKSLLVDKFNWAGDSLYNITLDDMFQLVDTSIAKGWSLGWEGDVTNPGLGFFSSYAKGDEAAHEYDTERVKNYASEITERDHMLHITGIGIDEKKNKWFYLKNSWGSWYGQLKGYIFMDQDYFKLNTVIMMVNKNGLPEILKEKLGIN